MKTIPAKTILSSYHTQGWFNSNYKMNLYKGCPHGCIYCDSRSSCYHIENFDEVRTKENALVILEKELKTKKKKGIIMTGAMSDPYNLCEKSLKLTRNALELIDKYMYGVSIITKSDLIVRDIDILSNISLHSPCAVNITITTYDDDLTKKIEPHAPSSKKRFSALQKLRENNILAGIILTPTLPFINDTKENIKLLIQKAKECNTSWIYTENTFSVSLRDNQQEYFYNKLDKLFPGIKNKYISTFGNTYWCSSPRHEQLWNVFQKECEKNNIIYKHDEINNLIIEKYKKEQLSLF